MRLRLWLAVGAGTVLVLAAALWSARGRDVATRLVTEWVPPQAAALPRDGDAERRAWEDLGQALAGRIVWSSNRTGNHELFLLELPAANLRQLTSNARVDFGARFSPDGTRIVFMRSRREWVSFRDKDSWDVMILDLVSGEQERVVRRGYHPTWGPGGESIVFARGGRVVRFDLETESETEIFDVAALGLGPEIWDPELHPDGDSLAVAIAHHGATVVTPGETDPVRLTDHHVCQTTWVPGTRDLLWMDASGNGGTRVMRGPADGSSAGEVFMDLPGTRSHEYFPRLSPDAEWLVWAATAEGHEHDRADYEIYAWRVGTPWDTAVRLTHFAGNDQWPDVFVD